MARHPSQLDYRTYWVTWGVLIGLSLVMIAMDTAVVARAAIVALLVLAMLAKGALIAGNFMHLRLERRALAIAVATAILATAAALFVLLAADAVRIAQLSAR